MSRNLPIWSPSIGDVTLTAALLAQIQGGKGGGFASTAITTVGAGVLTAAGIAGGQITRTGSVAAYTDTTDTAANIVLALGGWQATLSFQFNIKNATAYPQTITGGTGVTFSAAAVVPPFSIGEYYGTMGGTLAAPTVTVTHIETVPIRAAQAVSNPQATALATVGAGAITVAALNGGVLTRSGTQIAAFADTTDTGPNIISGMPVLLAIGASVEWTYVNNTIFPGTVTAGSGVTITGAAIVPANSWTKYLITYTGAGTVTFLCIGQGFFPKRGVTSAANGATPVAVVDAAVTAGSQISLTLATSGGTPHGAFVSSVTPGSGFSINSLAGDTSTYAYEIRG